MVQTKCIPNHLRMFPVAALLSHLADFAHDNLVELTLGFCHGNCSRLGCFFGVVDDTLGKKDRIGTRLDPIVCGFQQRHNLLDVFAQGSVVTNNGAGIVFGDSCRHLRLGHGIQIEDHLAERLINHSHKLDCIGIRQLGADDIPDSLHPSLNHRYKSFDHGEITNPVLFYRNQFSLNQIPQGHEDPVEDRRLVAEHIGSQIGTKGIVAQKRRVDRTPLIHTKRRLQILHRTQKERAVEFGAGIGRFELGELACIHQLLNGSSDIIQLTLRLHRLLQQNIANHIVDNPPLRF